MQAQRSATDQRVKELKKEISQLEEELKTSQKELDVLCVQEKALKERIKDLQHQQADSQQMDPAHLAKLEKQVKQFQKEYQKAADAAGAVQLEVQRSVSYLWSEIHTDMKCCVLQSSPPDHGGERREDAGATGPGGRCQP